MERRSIVDAHIANDSAAATIGSAISEVMPISCPGSSDKGPGLHGARKNLPAFASSSLINSGCMKS